MQRLESFLALDQKTMILCLSLYIVKYKDVTSKDDFMPLIIHCKVQGQVKHSRDFKVND